MQNIKIKAYNQLSGKQEYLDLSPNTTIALLFEAAPVGEISERQANYSNKIKIPVTTRNAAILQWAHEGLVSGNAAYSHIPCTVEVDGIKVFGKGSYMVLNQVTKKEYEIELRSGIASFSNAIKDSRLRDLPDYGKHGIPTTSWSVGGVANSYIGEKDVVIPVMDWNVEDYPTNLSDGLDNTLPEVAVSSLYPAVRLKKMIKSIVGNAGYTFKTDVEGDELYRNAAVLCVNGARAIEDRAEWYARYLLPTPGVSVINKHSYYKWNNDFIYSHFAVVNNNPYLLQYVFKQGGVASLKIRLKTDKKLYLNATFRSDVSNHIEFERDEYENTIKFSGAKDSYINIFLQNNSTTDTVNLWELDIEIAEFRPFVTDDYHNPYYPVVLNLPDISQADMFKQFLWMFGQMVHVDEDNKVVTTYGWKTVYNNRYAKDGNGNVLTDEYGKPLPARDWSTKVDARKATKKFIFGEYGRQSLIKYTDYEYTDEYGTEHTVKSSAAFTVNNAELEPEKTVAELNTIAVDEYPRFGIGMVAKIRHRLKNQADGDAPFAIVYLVTQGDGTKNEMKLNGNIKEDYPTLVVQNFIYARFNDITAEVLLENYYRTLQNSIMRKCMVYNERFLLTPNDVRNFDNRVPVYLEKYRMYFYVNKIDYRGAIATAELVAMLPDVEADK